MNRLPRWFLVSILVILVLTIAALLGGFFYVANRLIPAPTATPMPSSTPNYVHETMTAYIQPSPRPTQTPACLSWEQIDSSMGGQTLCVYGIIYSLSSSNQTSTRYQFGDEPNSFFIYSANYEYYDSATGKTLGPGACVMITGQVEVIEGVPSMDIDKSFDEDRIKNKFLFSTDPKICK